MRPALRVVASNNDLLPCCPKCKGPINEIRPAGIVYRACAQYDALHYFERIQLEAVPSLDLEQWELSSGGLEQCYGDNYTLDQRLNERFCPGIVKFLMVATFALCVA